jgi:aryl-alcohol dehydrogenase-like predicted oxidoreductase
MGSMRTSSISFVQQHELCVFDLDTGKPGAAHSCATTACGMDEVSCAGTMLCGESLDVRESHELFSTAADMGIHQWDCAEMYPVPQAAATQGRSEAILGEWLQGQRREDHVLTTKVAGPGGMDWLRGGPLRLDGENIAAALEGSLQRLRTDHVDTLLLHWPDRCASCLCCNATMCWFERRTFAFLVGLQSSSAMAEISQTRTFDVATLTWLSLYAGPAKTSILLRNRSAHADCSGQACRYVPMFGEAEYDPSRAISYTPFEDQLEALMTAQHLGKIRRWGVSNETPWGLAKWAAAAGQMGAPGPAVVQNAYNLLCRTADAGLLEACRAEGVELQAYSPLAMGLLTGKYSAQRMNEAELRSNDAHQASSSHGAAAAAAASLPAASSRQSAVSVRFQCLSGCESAASAHCKPDSLSGSLASTPGHGRLQHGSVNAQHEPAGPPACWTGPAHSRLLRYRSKYAEAESRCVAVDFSTTMFNFALAMLMLAEHAACMHGPGHTISESHDCRYRASQQCVQALEAYRQVAENAGLSMLALSMRWLLQRESVASVVLGATTAVQLAEQLAAIDEGCLPKRVLNGIDRIHAMRPSPCP